MKTGYRGTFVISWAQTEVDGLPGAPVASLGVGASWRWTGKPLRVDGPREVLDLEAASDEEDLRRRAAYVVQNLVGAAMDPAQPIEAHEVDSTRLNMGFEVTDGHASYIASLIDAKSRQPLLMFVGDMPQTRQLTNYCPPPTVKRWSSTCPKATSFKHATTAHRKCCGSDGAEFLARACLPCPNCGQSDCAPARFARANPMRIFSFRQSTSF